MLSRKIILPALLLLSVAAAPAQAFRFALGGMIGDPTTLTAQLPMGPRNVLDVHVGWDLGVGFLSMANWNWQFPGAFAGGRGAQWLAQLVPYVGIGGGFYVISDRIARRGLDNTFYIFGRVPLGISWPIPDSPVEVFVELAPGVSFFPDVDDAFTAGIGARFRFN
jgi:hypothetical protein